MTKGATDVDHYDVIIIGAGLSGIDAACHLRMKRPRDRVLILEARGASGGTWDLFRYPGIRSDSDMFTLGYGFRPWLGDNAIADGPSILSYIRETARAYGVDRKIRFGHKVVGARWSRETSTWVIEAEAEGKTVLLSCGFLFACCGYYDYDAGHLPVFPGADTFGGKLIHPQAWPEDLDCKGRAVVVIGSGATAVTLVPALVARGAAVTMVQRSPTYVVALPLRDRMAARLRQWLPDRLAYQLVRWRNILLGMLFYGRMRRYPERARAYLAKLAARRLGPEVDVSTHFNPRYDPWDQRLCVAPDGDLFRVLRNGEARIVTDEIESLTPEGLRLRSGENLRADVIVAATGLRLKPMGGVAFSVDGVAVDLSACVSYKGAMLSDVPNFAYALGYTNASWTLKCDLTSAFVCRVLDHMARNGYARCVAPKDPHMPLRPLIDFTSGYIQRSITRLPKQGTRGPWKLHQNYLADVLSLRFVPVADGVLTFARGGDATRVS